MVNILEYNGEKYFYDPKTGLGASTQGMEKHVERHPEIGAKNALDYFLRGLKIVISGKPYDHGFIKDGMYVGIKPGCVPNPLNHNNSLYLIRTVHKKRNL